MFIYENVYNLFHGTTNTFANSIIVENKFHITERKNHWLGNGIYFFINDYAKAEWWGRQACIRRRRKYPDQAYEPAVLYLRNYCIHRQCMLDLDTEEDRGKVNEYIKELKRQNASFITEAIDEEEKRALMLQIYVSYYGIKASKKTFFKDSIPKHKGLDTFGIENTEAQFCIYDDSTIDFNAIEVI